MADDSGLFPQHPRSGDWETLKGQALAPHLQMPLESSAMGDSRHQTNAMPSQMWDSNVVVMTGQTGGGGAMAK